MRFSNRVPWRFLLLLLALVAAGGCANVPPAPVENPPRASDLQPLPRTREPLVAFVLGGGAARGFAHVGVLDALGRHGIAAQLVVGTSAGSVAGALYAGGLAGEQLKQEALRLERDRVTDFIFPDRGFVRGALLQQYVNEALDGRPIEDLPRRFVAVATDLRTGELIAFDRGDAGMAVRASSSVPGVVQPVRIGAREYVDGGLVSPVPVQVARALGADVIIAVDVSRPPETTEHILSTLDVLHQSLLIMGRVIAARELAEADVVIRPAVAGIGLGDFDQRAEAIAAGEAAAEAALPRIRAALAQARRKRLRAAP